MNLKDTHRVIERISDRTDTALLFYSGGKDSMVTLDLIAPYFKKIICVFMYFVKDLEHVNRYLNWARARYKNIEIEQVPHWNLSCILRGGLFCVPNPNQKLLKLMDIEKAMRLRYGVYYTFYGMKKADSMNRRLMLNGYENYEDKGKVYPLADWSQKDILAYMRQKKLPMPIRYSKNASGGVGFNKECYLWMRDNAPEDLRKCLKAFPMSEKLLVDAD